MTLLVHQLLLPSNYGSVVLFLRYSMSKNIATLKSRSWVNQGHWNENHSIYWYGFLLVFYIIYSTFVPKTHRFFDIRFVECCVEVVPVTLNPGLGVTEGHRIRHDRSAAYEESVTLSRVVVHKRSGVVWQTWHCIVVQVYTNGLVSLGRQLTKSNFKRLYKDESGVPFISANWYNFHTTLDNNSSRVYYRTMTLGQNINLLEQ